MRLIAFVFPTLYFLGQKQWGKAFVTFILFGIGVALIFVAGLGLVFWAIAGVIALIHCKNKQLEARLDRHAEKIGQETAKAMRQS